MKIVKIVSKSGCVKKIRYVNLDNITSVEIIGVDEGTEDFDPESTMVYLFFNMSSNYDIKFTKDSDVVTDRYNYERKTTGWYEGDMKADVMKCSVVVDYIFFKKEIEPYLLSKM